MTLATTLKKKACRHCGAEFMPARPLAVVCSPICAARMVKVQKAQEKAQTKARKEAVKTLSAWRSDAQKAVNAYVRARDEGKPCISCGTPWLPTFQAGHYRSRGAAKNLALDTRNIFGQCIQCNLHKHSNAIEYRIRLVSRKGLEFVERLESDNTPRHHSSDDLRAIRKTYQDKLKALRRERESA